MGVPHQRVIAIVGPTATGKSDLAVRLASRVDGEVMNADSRQVYRGLDIGTAKPSPAERARVRHWLVDVVDPDEAFGLADFLQLAQGALRDCWRRGVVPIVCGGTGQYVWALLEGWELPRVPPDERLRAELEALVAERGLDRLIAELRAADERYVNRIDTRNPRRVIRAVEVLRHTGRLPGCERRSEPAFASTIIGLTCPRDELYRRIDARVDAMIGAGLVDEVRALNDRGYSCELPSMSSIGYRQVCQHLAGEMALDEAVQRIKTETHRLARMQRNWFKASDERIHWIDITEGDPFPEALRLVE